MFKITEIHRFSWPVEVKLPSQSTPGDIETQIFIGHFRLMSTADSAVFGTTMDEARKHGMAAVDAAELSQISAVMEGWGDVIGDDGAPVAFSAEALARACAFAPVRRGIVEAYAAGASGEARLGN